MADPETEETPEVEETDVYDPSTVEVNRSIEQGGGVGARDLARQREPTENAEHDPFKELAKEREDEAEEE